MLDISLCPCIILVSSSVGMAWIMGMRNSTKKCPKWMAASKAEAPWTKECNLSCALGISERRSPLNFSSLLPFNAHGGGG